MPVISREYHAHAGNYTPSGNRPRYIVVHYTANTACARQEATYAATSQHPSSYHFVLDGTGTIYQLLDVTDTAWAVGAWAGATQLIGNSESVSIEVCNNGEPFSIDQIAELRWLVRRLMVQLGIDADHVVRHWDCHTGRKSCPYFYTPDGGGGNSAWRVLHDTITRREEDMIMNANDVWNCLVAYQQLDGKQVNRQAWNIISWTLHNVEYLVQRVKEIQTKLSDTSDRTIKLEKSVAELTTLVKTQQKTLNTIVKKIA